MKMFLLICFLIPNIIIAQSKHKKINGVDFIFKTEQLEDVNNKQLTIFRNKQKLLTHTLLLGDGDSSSESYEIGDYKIKGDNIHFYTIWVYWSRPDDITYKYGFRKQVYKVKSDGRIQLLSSEITIRDALRIDPPDKRYFFESMMHYFHNGAFYVFFNKPKTDLEKAALEDYIKMIEQDYKSKFIIGRDQWKLEREVRSAVKNRHHEITKDWDPENREVYGIVYK